MDADQVDKLMDEARSIAEKIQQNLGKYFLSIVYSVEESSGGIMPYKHGKVDDATLLKYAIEKAELKKITILVNGPGGCFKQGMKMARTLRSGLDHYETYIPGICGSALCFPFLKGDRLTIWEDTIITQIDPFYYDSDDQLIRAVIAAKSQDENVRAEAKRILSNCKQQIMDLIKERPSLYNHKEDEWEEKYDTDNIASNFMMKPEHEDSLSYKELIGLNLKITKSDNNELKTQMKNYIEICQEILMYENKRVIIGCSKPFEPKQGTVGNFLMI